MESIDTDGFVAELRRCLSILLGESRGAVGSGEFVAVGDCEPSTEWDQLVQRASTAGRWSENRRVRVTERDPDSLYELAAELNERRTLHD